MREVLGTTASLDPAHHANHPEDRKKDGARECKNVVFYLGSHITKCKCSSPAEGGPEKSSARLYGLFRSRRLGCRGVAPVPEDAQEQA